MSDDDSYYADEPAMMDVFVETLTGSTFEMRVYTSDTVLDVKHKICRVEGIPVAHQNLLFQLTELADSQRLVDCGVANGSTLRLVLNMRGGPISTRRLNLACDQIPWKDLHHILDLKEQNRIMEEIRERYNNKVSLLVFKDGEVISLLRVIKNDDGTYSPYSQRPIAPPLYQRSTSDGARKESTSSDNRRSVVASNNADPLQTLSQNKSLYKAAFRKLNEDIAMRNRIQSLRSKMLQRHRRRTGIATPPIDDEDAQMEYMDTANMSVSSSRSHDAPERRGQCERVIKPPVHSGDGLGTKSSRNAKSSAMDNSYILNALAAANLEHAAGNLSGEQASDDSTVARAMTFAYDPYLHVLYRQGTSSQFAPGAQLRSTAASKRGNSSDLPATTSSPPSLSSSATDGSQYPLTASLLLDTESPDAGEIEVALKDKHRYKSVNATLHQQHHHHHHHHHRRGVPSGGDYGESASAATSTMIGARECPMAPWRKSPIFGSSTTAGGVMGTSGSGGSTSASNLAVTSDVAAMNGGGRFESLTTTSLPVSSGNGALRRCRRRSSLHEVRQPDNDLDIPLIKASSAAAAAMAATAAAAAAAHRAAAGDMYSAALERDQMTAAMLEAERWLNASPYCSGLGGISGVANNASKNATVNGSRARSGGSRVHVTSLVLPDALDMSPDMDEGAGAMTTATTSPSLLIPDYMRDDVGVFGGRSYYDISSRSTAAASPPSAIPPQYTPKNFHHSSSTTTAAAEAVAKSPNVIADPITSDSDPPPLLRTPGDGCDDDELYDRLVKYHQSTAAVTEALKAKFAVTAATRSSSSSSNSSSSSSARSLSSKGDSASVISGGYYCDVAAMAAVACQRLDAMASPASPTRNSSTASSGSGAAHLTGLRRSPLYGRRTTTSATHTTTSPPGLLSPNVAASAGADAAATTLPPFATSFGSFLKPANAMLEAAAAAASSTSTAATTSFGGVNLGLAAGGGGSSGGGGVSTGNMHSTAGSVGSVGGGSLNDSDIDVAASIEQLANDLADFDYEFDTYADEVFLAGYYYGSRPSPSLSPTISTTGGVSSGPFQSHHRHNNNNGSSSAAIDASLLSWLDIGSTAASDPQPLSSPLSKSVNHKSSPPPSPSSLLLAGEIERLAFSNHLLSQSKTPSPPLLLSSSSSPPAVSAASTIWPGGGGGGSEFRARPIGRSSPLVTVAPSPSIASASESGSIVVVAPATATSGGAVVRTAGANAHLTSDSGGVSLRATPTVLPDVVETRRKRLRCSRCNRRLNITNVYDCRCGRLFCAQHRYAETHDCAHDYKTAGRKLLAQQNPLVSGRKLAEF